MPFPGCLPGRQLGRALQLRADTIPALDGQQLGRGLRQLIPPGPGHLLKDPTICQSRGLQMFKQGGGPTLAGPEKAAWSTWPHTNPTSCGKTDTCPPSTSPRVTLLLSRIINIGRVHCQQTKFEELAGTPPTGSKTLAMLD